MAYIVREVDLDTELGSVVELMNANFPDPVSLDRFEWLYLANPAGRGTAWFVVDDRTGRPVGSTVVIPRRVRLPTGQAVCGWLGGDFSILKAYRTMGIAAKLRRAAKDMIDDGAVPFLFAHPNERMLAVHMNVGHQRLGEMRRYARRLRLRTASRFVNRLSGAALGVADALMLPGTGRYEVGWLEGAPGDEFTTLFDEAMSGRLARRTTVVRDAQYLTWRYSHNPLESTEFMTIRVKGRLAGYLVSSASGDTVTLKDWLVPEPHALKVLFSAYLREMRRRGIASASAITLEDHADLPLLTSLGFRARPGATTAVVYAGREFEEAKSVLTPVQWFMTVGDRDV